jgi:hypothetical protein
MLFILFYFCLFLLVDILLKYLNCSRSQKSNIQILLCFILLFVFFGFRDLSVLNDTSHYYEYVLNSTKYDSFWKEPFYHTDKQRFELGFQVFVRLLGKHVCSHPYTIILVPALITTIVNLFFLKKYTSSIALACFFQLTNTGLLSQYSAIRQGLAIAIFSIAFIFLLKNKTIFYVLFILLASTIHSTAIILLVVPIFKKLNLNKRTITIFFIITIICSICLNLLFNTLGYSSSTYYLGAISRETIALASILNSLTVALFLLGCFYIRKKYNIYGGNSFWWMGFLDVFFNIMAIQFPVMTRFSIYFYPFTIILFLFYMNSITNKRTRNRFLYFFVLFMFLRIVFILSLKNEWFHLYPYSFFDFGKDYHETSLGY